MDDFDPPSATDYTPTGGWFFILCGLFWLLFSGIAHATISSSNWTGYAATGSFASVSGSWTVPAITDQTGMVAQWVGLNGVSNGYVEQIGTWEMSRPTSTGQVINYFCWYELYPAGPAQIYSVNIAPGDAISASVTAASTGFTLGITDQTNGQSFTTTQTASGTASSAEWINEIFTTQGQAVAQFSPVTFSYCLASPSVIPEGIVVPGVETLSPFANNQFSVASVPETGSLSLLALGCLFLLWRKRGAA